MVKDLAQALDVGAGGGIRPQKPPTGNPKHHTTCLENENKLWDHLYLSVENSLKI